MTGSTILPRTTEDLPGTGGRIRVSLDDFMVEEVPAYAPSGAGEHLFVRFEKRDLTTREAVRRIASALGVDPRGAGWAGMKDRRAITTQWASFPGADAARARSIEVEGVVVQAAERHGNKLRIGHLRANRFRLVVREALAEATADATAVLARLERDGCPNYFGEQRFGFDGRNVVQAREWLVEGGRAPRDRFRRKLLVSALQAAMFNEATAERVREGTLGRPVAGDVLQKTDSGGLFVTDDEDEAARRLAGWEVSPTGPMFGTKMRWAEGVAGERERALLARWGLTTDDLARFRKHGEGTRRPYRVRPEGASVEALPDGFRVTFTLPPGAYATVIMAEIMKAGS